MMEYCSTTKKSESCRFAAIWREMEDIPSSEISQTQKAEPHISHVNGGKSAGHGQGLLEAGGQPEQGDGAWA